MCFCVQTNLWSFSSSSSSSSRRIRRLYLCIHAGVQYMCCVHCALLLIINFWRNGNFSWMCDIAGCMKWCTRRVVIKTEMNVHCSVGTMNERTMYTQLLLCAIWMRFCVLLIEVTVIFYNKIVLWMTLFNENPQMNSMSCIFLVRLLVIWAGADCNKDSSLAWIVRVVVFHSGWILCNRHPNRPFSHPKNLICIFLIIIIII